MDKILNVERWKNSIKLWKDPVIKVCIAKLYDSRVVCVVYVRSLQKGEKNAQKPSNVNKWEREKPKERQRKG